MPMIISCAFCGALVTRTPGVVRQNKQSYCSNACRGKGHAQQSRAAFWDHVARCSHGSLCQDCCWLWTANRSRWGYGQVVRRTDGRQHAMGAHRMNWLLTHGAIPDGLLVLHNCPGGDNKACVNPQHLWLGTYKDNAQDALKKGQFPTGDRHGARRHPRTPHTNHRNVGKRGEDNPRARLTADQVRSARTRYAEGWTYRRIAEVLQCDKSTIRLAVQHITWKHID